MAYITGITVSQRCRPEVPQGSLDQDEVVGETLSFLGPRGGQAVTFLAPGGATAPLSQDPSSFGVSVADISQDSFAFKGSRVWFEPQGSGVSSPFQGP